MPRDKTARKIATEYGVTTKTVDDWCKAGLAHFNQGRGKPRRFDSQEVDLFLASRETRTRGDAEGEALRKQKLQEEIRKLKLANDEYEGQLIRREDVEAEYVTKIGYAKQKLLGIADSLAGALVGRDMEDIQRMIDGKVREALGELSGLSVLEN